MSEDSCLSTLRVHEIYPSVQGESTWAGLPCTFVRLTFCDLRCTWCDTEYAFEGGKDMKIETVLKEVERQGLTLVEVTGGEPLAQPPCLDLLKALCDRSHTVLLETGGHRDIAPVDLRVHRIMDLKCPDSKMSRRNRWENIPHLTLRDEVKFVIASRRDFEWARDRVQQYELNEKVNAVLFSPVFGQIDPRDLVQWILAEKVPVRFQLQLHKFIWDPAERGV